MSARQMKKVRITFGAGDWRLETGVRGALPIPNLQLPIATHTNPSATTPTYSGEKLLKTPGSNICQVSCSGKPPLTKA